jgi:hypothetical protein
MKQVRLVATVLVLSISVFPIAASADSSCSAHNDSGGTCSITCPSGQSASCSNTTGANPPICQCVSSGGNELSVSSKRDRKSASFSIDLMDHRLINDDHTRALGAYAVKIQGVTSKV